MKRLLFCLVVLAWLISARPLRALELPTDASYPWATVEVECDSGDKTVFVPNTTLDTVYYARHSWTDGKKTCKLQELTKPTSDGARIAAHFVIERSGMKTELVLVLPIVTKAEAKWTRLNDHLRVRAYASDFLTISSASPVPNPLNHINPIQNSSSA